MAPQTEYLREVAGRQINHEEVIARLKLEGAWQEALDALSDEALVAEAARQQSLTVSDDELQQAFDSFRQSRELEKADDTHDWLKRVGLSVEQVESYVEAGILAAKTAEKLITDEQIDAYYNQNPQEFEYTRLSEILLEEQGAAEEVALSIREEGEDFAKLARKHSLDDATRAGGGFRGLVTRDETQGLPEEITNRLFAAKAGEVIGPFADGDVFCLVRVEEVGHSPLDDELRSALRQQLFSDWIAEKAAG